MKYADLVKDAHYTKVAYLTDVLNAVVSEARETANPNKAVESLVSNWRLTGEEHTAIVEEARRIMKV